jgi:hypothetical protein
MVKYFCDACGKESELHRFRYLCHIDDLRRRKNTSGYIDSEGNLFSRRENEVGLCAKCYNKIVVKSIDELISIKNNKKQ